jgi:hypothetical protein
MVCSSVNRLFAIACLVPVPVGIWPGPFTPCQSESPSGLNSDGRTRRRSLLSL